jgi:TRAP-type C4-dicarboxylate transport system permease small subunit
MNRLLTTLAANITPVVDKDSNEALDVSVSNILNAIIGVLGLVAVVVIIIGGVSYMTSAGDAGKVKKAKDTILYGVIGLIIVALAFAIVNFVIGNILKQ